MVLGCCLGLVVAPIVDLVLLVVAVVVVVGLHSHMFVGIQCWTKGNLVANMVLDMGIDLQLVDMADFDIAHKEVVHILHSLLRGLGWWRWLVFQVVLPRSWW